jgi:hypothetical protein
MTTAEILAAGVLQIALNFSPVAIVVAAFTYRGGKKKWGAR